MANPKPRTDHLEKYKTSRSEACTEQINIRIPPSIKAKLKNIDGWRESIREHLKELTAQSPR